MLRISQVYKSSENFDDFLTRQNISKTNDCLVRILTSDLQKDGALKVAKEIRQTLPNSHIMGISSAGGVVMNGEVVDDCTVVVIDMFHKSEVVLKHYKWDTISPAELAALVHEDFAKYSGDRELLVNVIFGDHYPPLNEFLEETNKFSPIIQLSGGVAGDILSTGLAGYIFSDECIFEHGVFAMAVVGEHVRNFARISTSVEPISKTFTITKADGNIIEEIENEPALKWMYDYLELDEDNTETFGDWTSMANDNYLSHFPLLLENSAKSTRYTRYDEESGKLALYYSRLPSGTNFRVSYVNPSKTMSETHDVCRDILDVPVEYMFVYACLFRRTYLSSCIKWELLPFENFHVCGVFLMGEIGSENGKNILLNGSSSFIGFAENESYILPDVSKLADTKLIEDNDSFVKTAQQKSREHLSFNNASLLKKINAQQALEKIESDYDLHLSLPNIYKFEKDREKLSIDKIFVIDVSTADTTIASVGQETYYSSCRVLLKKVTDRMEQRGLDATCSIYIINYKTFAITGDRSMSPDFFLGNMKILFNEFEYGTYSQIHFSTVLRGAVVINQENGLETALNLLLATKDSTENFIVHDKGEDKSSLSNHEESRIINLISSAIENDNIIPYYQGLHNNNIGKIDKYEALMRLVDLDGNVYTPFVFMDIAKKYKFYSRISMRMIEKVLEDFKDRDETVSINVSMQDIQSDAFRVWLIEKLKNYPSPERIIIEFVETENYQALNTLFDFVTDLKTLGSGIAIDDFGSGYSTFSTVLSLSPNFIKIDGSIVKDLENNSDNMIILNTIKFLATQMKTKTVAEFVENAEIQKIVEDHDVMYSQGYHFAKPMPINEIDKVK